MRSARRGVYAALAGGRAIAAMACRVAVGTPRYKFAMVSHAPAGDTFWNIIRKGAQAAADKDNIEFLYTSDGWAPRQAQLIEAAINQKV